MGSWRVVAICILAAAISVLGITSAAVHMRIVTAVNCKLPPKAQFEMYGWWAGKTIRLRDEYRRLYPRRKIITAS